MHDYQSWQPRYRAICADPGPEDLFVVILIDGRRVAIHPATDHFRWRWAAERLAASHQCQVKVLPMTGTEAMNFYGIKPAPPQSIENIDPAFREQAVENCFVVLSESGSQRDREQALELLTHLGAFQLADPRAPIEQG